MNALSATDLLHIWEQGEGRGSIERGLLILSAALPSASWQELLALPVGERDRLLLMLRRSTFGAFASGYDECEACGARVEFELRLQDLLSTPESHDLHSVPRLVRETLSIDLRRVTSDDLQAAAFCRDPDQARLMLLRRCITEARSDGGTIGFEQLSTQDLSCAEEYLASADPMAELLVGIDCPTCSHRWHTIFDIVSFFWTEISTAARRLLQQVHLLARAYGWHEADILAMSPVRRSYYLEMVR